MLNEETAKSFPFLSKLTETRIAEGRDDRFFASFNLGDRPYRSWWDSDEPLRQLLPRRLHRARRDAGHLRAAGGERLRHVRPARLCPHAPWAASRSRRADPMIGCARLLVGLALAAAALAAGRWRSTGCSRPTCRATRTGRPRSSTPTAACCAPSPRPTASGGSRPRPTTSIRSISRCSRPTRIAASTHHWGVDPLAAVRAAEPVDRARAHRLGRLDALHAGRPPARAAAAQPAHQGDPVGARPAARMALLQARGAGDLPHAGADGRQSRRRARRLLRLFRQGAAGSSAPPRRPCWSPSRNRPSAAGPTASPAAAQAGARPRAGARPASTA